MSTVKSLRAVAYCRISRDPDGTELGVQRQERQIRELCEREGWELVAVFADDDTSAYGRKRRDGFDAMLKAIGEPDIGIVIGWTVDRLTRNMRVGEDLIERIVETKTRTRLVINGEIDLNTSSGRMMFRILCTMAVAESELKQARIKSKHEELREAGAVSGGGSRPFGFVDYTRDALGQIVCLDRKTIIESEAKLIREMRDRVFAGDALGSIAQSLNTRGVKTPSAGRELNRSDGSVTICSGKWSGTAVRQLLMSARIAGMRERDARNRAGRGELIKAQWDAIISLDDRSKLVAILTAPERKSPRGRPPYLLTGVLRCGECGAMLSGHVRKDKSRPDVEVRRYVCRKQPGRLGCGRVTIDAAKADLFVTAAVRHRLRDGKIDELANVDDGDADAADLSELRRIDAELGEIGKLFAQPGSSKAMLAAAASELESLRLACNDRLRSSTANCARVALRATQARLRGVWPDDVETQRIYVRDLLTHVTVARASGTGRFNPERIDMTDGWRV